jgi:hypothetical protein
LGKKAFILKVHLNAVERGALRVRLEIHGWAFRRSRFPPMATMINFCSPTMLQTINPLGIKVEIRELRHMMLIPREKLHHAITQLHRM